MKLIPMFLGATGRVLNQEKKTDSKGWYIPKTRNSLEAALRDILRKNPAIRKKVEPLIPITINDVMRGEKQ